jgi:hypothetical protein
MKGFQVGSLNSEIQTELRASRTPQSSRLQEIADALTGDDRADYIAALHDKTISAYALAKVLCRRGFKVSHSLIAMYRRGALSYEVR